MHRYSWRSVLQRLLESSHTLCPRFGMVPPTAGGTLRCRDCRCAPGVRASVTGPDEPEPASGRASDVTPGAAREGRGPDLTPYLEQLAHAQRQAECLDTQ